MQKYCDLFFQILIARFTLLRHTQMSECVIVRGRKPGWGEDDTRSVKTFPPNKNIPTITKNVFVFLALGFANIISQEMRYMCLYFLYS